MIAMEFKPGRLGFRIDWPILSVASTQGGQAILAGVDSGWKLMLVDGKPIDKESFLAKITGDCSYVIRFDTTPEKVDR